MAEESINNQEEQGIQEMRDPQETLQTSGISARPMSETDRAQKIALGNDVFDYLQCLLDQTAPFYAIPNQVKVELSAQDPRAEAQNTAWLMHMQSALIYSDRRGAEMMYHALIHLKKPTLTGCAVLRRLNTANELMALLDRQRWLKSIRNQLKRYADMMYHIPSDTRPIVNHLVPNNDDETINDCPSLAYVAKPLNQILIDDAQQVELLIGDIDTEFESIGKDCRSVFSLWLPDRVTQRSTALYRVVYGASDSRDNEEIEALLRLRQSLIERMGQGMWPRLSYSKNAEENCANLDARYQAVVAQCHYLKGLEHLTLVIKQLLPPQEGTD